MIRHKIPGLLLAIVMVAMLVVPVSAVSYTLYENYINDGNAQEEIYSADWVAQTFTTTESHTIDQIRLKLYKEGTPGILTVDIKEVNATGYPVGTALASATYNGELLSTVPARYTLDFTTSYALEGNTTYAFVAHGTGASIANCIHIYYRAATGGYGEGCRYSSTSSGTSWTKHADDDITFEIYGLPAMELKGANVYSGYLEDDDWLFVIEYKNVLAPYYGEVSSQDSFWLQLTKADDTLVAQTPLPAWGYKPGSIYLSAASVSSLEWGAAYKVKMYGIASPHYNVSYTLTAADWRGSSLAILDDWCLILATRLEAYYDETFLVPSPSGTTEVLNIEGGVIFATGIPYLDVIRPGIFQISVYDPDWEEGEWTNAYPESLPDWEVAVGATFAGIFNDIGTAVSLDGQWVGAIILFVIYFALGIGVLGMGHGLSGLVLATPILMAGFYFKLIPFAVLGVVIAIAALILIRQFWWKTT